MSTIISAKRNKKNEKGVILEVLTDYSDYLKLQGHLDDVHLFTENEGQVKTHISQRGKNGATKYFLIPRELRNGLHFGSAISCQRIDRQNKTFFVYVLDKFKLNKTRREIAVEKFSDSDVVKAKQDLN